MSAIRSSPARRAAAGRVAAAAFVAGLAVTGVLTWLAYTAYQDNEARLLSLQTGLTKAALGADPLYVEDHVGGAVQLAAATGKPGLFIAAVHGIVGPREPLVDASLWRAGSAPPARVAQIGAPALAGTPTLRSLFSQAARAARAGSFAAAKIATGDHLRIAYAAYAASRKAQFVAVAEEALPADRRISEPASSPIHELNLALYWGPRVTRSQLLETDSSVPLPLTGTTARAEIPFGLDTLTLVMSPRGSLAGEFAEWVPWGIAGIGVLVSIATAVAVESLVRRRRGAERAAAETRRLLEAERDVTEVLQRAMLPADLHAPPALSVATCYQPATSRALLGGDWYDLIEIDADHVLFTIGDVSGHGLEAATLMASIRYAVQAYAAVDAGPEAVMERLSRYVDLSRSGHFATLLCGRLDLRDGSVDLVSAGHLAPLLVGRGGARFVELEPGPPIGVFGKGFSRRSFVLGRQETLVCFTDGLVERRGESLDVGLARLRSLAPGERSLRGLIDRLSSMLPPDGPADDVAILALRWNPGQRGGRA